MYKFLGNPVVAPVVFEPERMGFSTDTLSLKRFKSTTGAHRWRITFDVAEGADPKLLGHMSKHMFSGAPFEAIVPQPIGDPNYIEERNNAHFVVQTDAPSGATSIQCNWESNVFSGWSFNYGAVIYEITGVSVSQSYSSSFGGGSFFDQSLSHKVINLDKPLQSAITAGTRVDLLGQLTFSGSIHEPGATTIVMTRTVDEDLTGRIIRFANHRKLYLVTNHQANTLDIEPGLIERVMPNTVMYHWNVTGYFMYDDDKTSFSYVYKDGVRGTYQSITLMEA